MTKAADYSIKKLSTHSVVDLQKLRDEIITKLGVFRSSLSKSPSHQIRLARQAIARINTLLTARQGA